MIGLDQVRNDHVRYDRVRSGQNYWVRNDHVRNDRGLEMIVNHLNLFSSLHL